MSRRTLNCIFTPSPLPLLLGVVVVVASRSRGTSTATPPHRHAVATATCSSCKCRREKREGDSPRSCDGANSKPQLPNAPLPRVTHLANCFSASMPLPRAENGLRQLSSACLLLSRTPAPPRPPETPAATAEAEAEADDRCPGWRGLRREANSERSLRVISASTRDAREDMPRSREVASASPAPFASSSAAAW